MVIPRGVLGVFTPYWDGTCCVVPEPSGARFRDGYRVGGGEGGWPGGAADSSRPTNQYMRSCEGSWSSIMAISAQQTRSRGLLGSAREPGRPSWSSICRAWSIRSGFQPSSRRTAVFEKTAPDAFFQQAAGIARSTETRCNRRQTLAKRRSSRWSIFSSTGTD